MALKRGSLSAAAGSRLRTEPAGRRLAGVKLKFTDKYRTSVTDPNRTSLPFNFGANRLLSICAAGPRGAGRRRLSVWWSGLGARLHLAAVDKCEGRIEDHLISGLDPAVNFHPRAQIALHVDLAELHPAVADNRH